jgi:prepilin-type N-terminal cleavage/methylation domain-containing protein
MLSKNGFSLVEMMITLAISAIIIGAAFGSYTIISRNFEWQKDMKYISQSARNVIEMIQKDIRNAGFRFEANAAITDPVKIYDAGDCCDRIEIIYDETINKRVKIEYRLQQYSNDNARFRLYKKKTNLSSNNAVEYDTPIADYVEALQFTGSRGDCTDGIVQKGCGKEQLVTPSSARYVTLHGRNNNTCSDDILKIFDGDPNTFWSCTRDSGEYDTNNKNYLLLTFPVEFRPTKVIINGSLSGVNGGSFDLSQGESFARNGCSGYGNCFTNTTHPWGTSYPTNLNTSFAFLRAGTSPSAVSDQIHTEGGWRCIANPVIENFFSSSWHPPGVRNCGDNNYYYGNLTYNQNLSGGPAMGINPVTSKTIKFEGDGSSGHSLDLSYSKYLTIRIDSEGDRCAYSSDDEAWQSRYHREGVCNITWQNDYIAMSDMAIYGEVFTSGSLTPQEVRIEILQRSPNEHGNSNRSYSSTIGNYYTNVNDKYLRDNYLTSATMRNVYYQSP